MSCWVRRHFINSVKLCLWLILHFLELLVNSAKFFLSFSSKHGVCLSQWGLISHRAGSDIRSQVESQIQVNEWGLNTVIGSQQMVMPVLNRSRVCVNDPPGVKCTLALYSCTMIVHLVQESQKPEFFPPPSVPCLLSCCNDEQLTAAHMLSSIFISSDRNAVWKPTWTQRFSDALKLSTGWRHYTSCAYRLMC